MTTNTPAESLEKESISLKEQITALTKDLLYPSESDEPITYFEMELSTQEPIGIANFKLFNGILPETASTEITFEDFFKPLIEVQDWFGEDEKKWAADALTLKNSLSEKLTGIQLFKIGTIEISIYLFGKSEEHHWEGIMTKVIET